MAWWSAAVAERIRRSAAAGWSPSASMVVPWGGEERASPRDGTRSTPPAPRPFTLRVHCGPGHIRYRSAGSRPVEGLERGRGRAPGAHPELAEQGRHVVVDGPLRDHQVAGDLGVGEPVAEQ